MTTEIDLHDSFKDVAHAISLVIVDSSPPLSLSKYESRLTTLAKHISRLSLAQSQEAMSFIIGACSTACMHPYQITNRAARE